MKIYSTFHDYYDQAALAYQDPEPRYDRREQALLGDDACGVPLSTNLPAPVRDALTIFITMPREWVAHPVVSARLIVACGKIYPFYSGYRNARQFGSYPVVRDLASLSFRDVYPKEDLAPTGERPWINTKERPPRIPVWRCPLNEAGWTKFQEVVASCPAAAGLNIFYKCPIVSVQSVRSGDYRLVGNPRLKDFAFQQIVPANIMAQELEMYLSNQLVEQRDPVPDRTDDLIRDAHGFDAHSFRNTKPDRRKRKQA